jgi:hypothetical protein
MVKKSKKILKKKVFIRIQNVKFIKIFEIFEKNIIFTKNIKNEYKS